MAVYEKNYQFRERMSKYHRKDRLDNTLTPNNDEYVIKDGIVIYIDSNDEVIYTAARDFVDYLYVSMNISACIKCGIASKGENAISVYLAENAEADLGEYACYRGYKTEISEGISIIANDYRGGAQALYYLEDLMNIRHAPFLKKGSFSRKPMYSPQMVHSGFGLDWFPNEHLSAIAHEGRDAILVFTKGANLVPNGYLDFNDLIVRAKRYGIDVYAYSYIKSEKHPEDEDAKSYYAGTYGTLFKTCPGLKGVVMVGESVCFPSKDPHVSPTAFSPDGIPSIKQTSFYYPCMDYVELVSIIRDSVREQKPDADIVFWSYNFFGAPKDARIKLINALPEDISLLVTFETGQRYDMNGIKEFTSDYTLQRAEYSDIFRDEAEAAHKNGIRLYSMTNTAGLSWDMGTIPYQPAPFQWIKRYRAMEEAHDNWGLCGLMESHHYGIYPSFISKLAKWCFTKTDLSKSMEDMLSDVIISEFGAENLDAVTKALKYFSDAAPYIVPTGEDQYGAFRIGPSYPLCLGRKINVPSMPHAMFGNRIVVPYYCEEFDARTTLISEKIHKEISSLAKMSELTRLAVNELEKAKNVNEQICELLNMGRFMLCYIRTGINAKKWHILISKFNCHSEKNELAEVIDNMEALLYEERENALEAIEYVKRDSRLGWEPSMEYMCDEEHIKWKIRMIDFVLAVELKNYKTSLTY